MSDRGTLTLGEQTLTCQLALQRDGAVRHYLTDLPDNLKPEAPLRLAIDAPFRLMASRSHSAGHLISHVVETLRPGLIPDKGHHFCRARTWRFRANWLTTRNVFTTGAAAGRGRHRRFAACSHRRRFI